jgi:hypothetical protein
MRRTISVSEALLSRIHPGLPTPSECLLSTDLPAMAYRCALNSSHEMQDCCEMASRTAKDETVPDRIMVPKAYPEMEHDARTVESASHAKQHQTNGWYCCKRRVDRYHTGPAEHQIDRN